MRERSVRPVGMRDSEPLGSARTVAVAAVLVLSVVVPALAGTATAQPDVSVTEYDLETTKLTVGGTLNATATVTNDGNETGTATVNLTVDGSVAASETVEVAANGSENVALSTSFGDSGGYAVAVDGLDATTVTVAAPDDDGDVSAALPPEEELLRTGGIGRFDVILNGTDGGVGSVDIRHDDVVLSRRLLDAFHVVGWLASRLNSPLQVIRAHCGPLRFHRRPRRTVGHSYDRR